jgi:Mrp family chromosome partitioning ATPase
MVDLTQDMTELMLRLEGHRSDSEGTRLQTMGRVLMFISAFGGEGVSTCAREYARCEAVVASRPVWLIDADLNRQSQLPIMATEAERFGPPGPLSSATPDGSVFYSVTPASRNRQGHIVSDARFLVARPFLERRLWVTRFREKNLLASQRVGICQQTSYWQAMRYHAQTIVIDAPSLDRSRHGLQLAPFVDGVIIVVSEDTGDLESRLALRDALAATGAPILGLFYNRVTDRAPA